MFWRSAHVRLFVFGGLFWLRFLAYFSLCASFFEDTVVVATISFRKDG